MDTFEHHNAKHYWGTGNQNGVRHDNSCLIPRWNLFFLAGCHTIITHFTCIYLL